jgi:adenylate cyclase
MSVMERSSIRKNFMQNSMEQFRDIMKQTNIEMERELDRMPIGKFRFCKLLATKKVTPTEPRATFYGRDSITEDDLELGYQAKKMNEISKLFLKFTKHPKWEWPFLNQTDFLLKYSMLMSFIVLLIIFAIQVLNRS